MIINKYNNKNAAYLEKLKQNTTFNKEQAYGLAFNRAEYNIHVHSFTSTL